VKLSYHEAGHIPFLIVLNQPTKILLILSKEIYKIFFVTFVCFVVFILHYVFLNLFLELLDLGIGKYGPIFADEDTMPRHNNTCYKAVHTEIQL